MKKDDFLYGAHSGIQKAIRRGDLDLAKTCFDAMWEDKQHRNWLKWRIPVLVAEEVLWMAGELAKFYKQEDKGEEEWRKLIYRLCIATKMKDGDGLWPVAERKASPVEHDEYLFIREWQSRMKAEDPVSIVEGMTNTLLDSREHSQYEKDAIDVLRRRVYQGGMIGDKYLCLVSIMMISKRGLDEKEVERQLKKDVERRRATISRAPKRIALPWYVFDMHTAKGKWALNILMKKAENLKGLSKEEIMAIWFFQESALVPLDQTVYVALKEKPTIFESMWWPQNYKVCQTTKRRSVKENKAFWDNELRAKVKALVLWCLEK